MAIAVAQKTRRLNFAVTSKKENDLVLHGFQGHEEISRLSWFDLDLRSHDLKTDPKSLVGHTVTFHVKYHDDSPRVFSGYISQFSAGPIVDDKDGPQDDRTWRHYHARVVPWLWFLTRKSNCRIFFQKTVKEIIKKVFDDAGFNGHYDDSKLDGKYPKREYCVQYRETDFNFVSRLMEEEGIFYFFQHSKDGKHTLVLGDSDKPWSDAEDVYTDHSGGHKVTSYEYFSQWEHTCEFRSGSWAQTDYDFKTPSKLLGVPVPTHFQVSAGEINNQKFELYDYPGFVDVHDGEDKIEAGNRLTTLRMEEEEAGHNVVHGASEYRSLGPGARFKIGPKHRAHDSEAQKQFVVTSIQHIATETTHYGSGSEGGGGQDYHNSFTCMPAKEKFRPARLTPKPVVHGSQTARVVGPDGEEIYCDEFGRVKVEFFWDRAGFQGERPEVRSCWIRVANNLAGKQWGFVAVPRVGQEVVVEFLEGDPDRPLIVGSVYNKEQKLHYSLAEGADRDKNKTKTYLITNSSPGGKGFNELMFDDKADHEQVFVHAQKNMDVRVRNDSKERIYGNRHQIIGWEDEGKEGGNQYELVHKDKHLHIKGNHAEKIEGDMQLTIGGGKGGNLDLVVDKNRAEMVSGNDNRHVKLSLNEKVDGSVSMDVGMSQNTKVGMISALEAGQTVHIKSGMTLVLEAGVQLSLKVGGSFVDISPLGVCITGPMVMINGTGSAQAQAL
ncbi:MAG: type VI secretion system tip protein VgrG [Planctomycetia bacterium]|nr:type VI secretion system tip protein VgrG [Planctomycetia bacterium]